MNAQDLKIRARDFGLEVVRAVELLPRTKTAEVIGKQLMRSAVSVGANDRAACRARSRNDFICKINIAEEEADEASYWLELLLALRLLDADRLYPLLREASELAAIFTASGRTAKQHRAEVRKGNPQFAIRNSQ
ncbi:MAG: four helix bundle protein [Candidatus Omnitrophica bacterium]|nr:four helix bundle protein [Candidatus Omnitrophota bacterium]